MPFKGSLKVSKGAEKASRGADFDTNVNKVDIKGNKVDAKDTEIDSKAAAKDPPGVRSLNRSFPGGQQRHQVGSKVQVRGRHLYRSRSTYPAN